MAVTKDIKTAKSVQEIWNLGFDTEFNLPIVELGVYNPTTSAIDRMTQPSGDSKYATNHLDDYTTTNVTYACQEDKDGNWKIIKIDESGNYPVITYATIVNNPTMTTFTLAFNSRTSLTYNLYSVAM